MMAFIAIRAHIIMPSIGVHAGSIRIHGPFRMDAVTATST